MMFKVVTNWLWFDEKVEMGTGNPQLDVNCHFLQAGN